MIPHCVLPVPQEDRAISLLYIEKLRIMPGFKDWIDLTNAMKGLAK
jgi:hypothetical protein